MSYERFCKKTLTAFTQYSQDNHAIPKSGSRQTSFLDKESIEESYCGHHHSSLATKKSIASRTAIWLVGFHELISICFALLLAFNPLPTVARYQ